MVCTLKVFGKEIIHMKKKILSTILIIGLTASLVACGDNERVKKEENSETKTVSAEKVINDVEKAEETEEVTEPVSVDKEETETSYRADDYEEQQDIFVYKHIDSGDGTQIDFTDQEQFDGPFVLSDSIDIYSYFFTYAGYTKPNIKVDIIRKIGDWIFVPFAKSSFLVKAEDFDKVAVLKEKTEDTINEDYANVETESTLTGQAKTPSQNEDGTDATNETASVPKAEAQPATTYSEEEVISIFRSTLESNGIQWYPDSTEYAQWPEAGPSGGMGWGIENISMTDPYGDAAGTVEGLQFGGDKYYYLENQGSSNGYVHLKLYSG